MDQETDAEQQENTLDSGKLLRFIASEKEQQETMVELARSTLSLEKEGRVLADDERDERMIVLGEALAEFRRGHGMARRFIRNKSGLSIGFIVYLELGNLDLKKITDEEWGGISQGYQVPVQVLKEIAHIPLSTESPPEGPTS